MTLSTKIKLSFIFVIVSFFVFSLTRAATLDLSLEKDIVSTKDDVSVLVSINSENQNINAAQAMITFPANLLSVTGIDQSSSVFSFWLEGPAYDNDKGQIRFVGGAITGLNGSGLKVMKISFKVKGSGSGRLGITDGAIMASDGSGSNVYSTAKGLDINIPTTSEFQAVQLERAKVQSTIAKKLPDYTKIGLDVPFYPDSTKWNNRSASFQAKWNIGSDIVAAAIAVNKNAIFTPEASAEAMSGSKIFSALSDGVWYIHLRVKNNIGWSQTLHYRIAIDTAPPSPFVVSSDSTFKTSNPKPTISFSSSDLASGISGYTISLDGVVASTTSLTSYTFLPILPGVHRLVVAALDKAGNSSSQTESLEIVPIASPEITYLSREVFANEGSVIAGGTASARTNVIVQIQNLQKQNVFEQTVSTDDRGNWNITVDKVLNLGQYRLLATARNENDALSLPAISENISIKEKPILIFGSFALSQTNFFLILISCLLLILIISWLVYVSWRRQLGKKVISAEKNIEGIIGNLEKEVEKLSGDYADGKITKAELAEGEQVLKDMKSNLEKTHNHVIVDIRDIGK